MSRLPSFDFTRLPRICGHRGAKGTAPENTLASVRKAAQIGVTFIEFDVNLAADDIVVFHDYTLDRCTNGSGPLVEQRYSQLSTLDAGSHFSSEFAGEKVPRFSEVVGLLDELTIGANVEIKSEPGNEQATVRGTVDIIRKQWPRHLPLLMSSFSEEVMRLLAQQLPEVSRGWLVKSVPEDWREKLVSFSASSFHCGDRFLEAEHVAAANQAGYPVLVYTVNDRSRASELLDWGVSSVISDHPERMMDLV